MIVPTRVWTKRGWVWPDDLFVGDTTISYNPQRNCTELDVVSEIHTDWKEEGFIGLQYKSMNQLITVDHPMMILNHRERSTERIAAQDVFLRSFSINRQILFNRGFEPYDRTQSMDDIKWSARYAASFAQVKNFDEYPHEIWNIIENLTETEAKQWIDTFCHWNIKRAASLAWMFIILLRNHVVRDMIMHVAPRAGIGAQWSRHHNYFFKSYLSMWSIKLTGMSQARAHARRGWYLKRYEGVTFNIATKNGNFLSRSKTGTSLVACDKT